jgi:hypothetical protein
MGIIGRYQSRRLPHRQVTESNPTAFVNDSFGLMEFLISNSGCIAADRTTSRPSWDYTQDESDLRFKKINNFSWLANWFFSFSSSCS